MLQSAFNLFVLRELPWSTFNFSRWQAVLGFALIGLLTGLAPSMRAGSPDMPAMPLGIAVAFSVLLILVCVPINQLGVGRGWNWGSFGYAVGGGALTGFTSGGAAWYFVPRVAFYGGFGAGRMGW